MLPINSNKVIKIAKKKGIKKLKAGFIKLNTGSKKVLIKNGFKIEGKLKSEITHITKTEWKKLSKYQVHRYKWLCEHHSELEGKSEKQITQKVKEAWRAKLDEITAKAKIRKARAKEVARRKEEGSRVSLKKCRHFSTVLLDLLFIFACTFSHGCCSHNVNIFLYEALHLYVVTCDDV